jgi:hypothetical protein
VFALDALGDAGLGWLLAAILLHVCGQMSRGLAWHGVLRASWPAVTRRSACAWHVCGAGLTGVLSARGGDLVRIALARRALTGATWPALAGSLAAEGSFDAVCGLMLALLAAALGIGVLAGPSPVAVVGVAVAGAAVMAGTARSPQMRRLVHDVQRGLAVLGEPRRWLRQVLPWQVCARVLRLAAVTCFLRAFGVPATPAVVIAACAAQGSGALLPIPGAGPAAVGAALLVAVPIAAGHAVDRDALGALAVGLPATLTVVGAALSTVLLMRLAGARSPRALLRAASAPAAIAGADG